MRPPLGKYILVDGKPVHEPNALKWGLWFETSKDRIVVYTRDVVPGVDVSTVFLGIDCNFEPTGEAVLWETAIFGGPDHGDLFRYNSREKAVAGHEVIVEQIRKVHAASAEVAKKIGAVEPMGRVKCRKKEPSET